MEETKTDNQAKDTAGSPDKNWGERYYHRRKFLLIPLLFSFLLIGLLFFGLGSFAGHRKATYFGPDRFTAREDFGFRGGMMNGGFGASGYGRFGHGVLGAVTSISGNNITIKQNGNDVTVVVASTTSIYKKGAIAKQSDIVVGDVIIVSGAPQADGSIAATVIRIN